MFLRWTLHLVRISPVAKKKGHDQFKQTMIVLLILVVMFYWTIQQNYVFIPSGIASLFNHPCYIKEYLPALYCSLWCSVNTPCKMISILICSLVERAIVHAKIHGGNPPENLWWHKFSESPKPLQRGDGTLYHKDFSFSNQSFFLLGKSLPRPWGIIVIEWHRYILSKIPKQISKFLGKRVYKMYHTLRPFCFKGYTTELALHALVWYFILPFMFPHKKFAH